MANSTGITVLIKLFHKYERAWGQGSKLPVRWLQPKMLIVPRLSTIKYNMKSLLRDNTGG